MTGKRGIRIKKIKKIELRAKKIADIVVQKLILW
jgi:hypothetical protein